MKAALKYQAALVTYAYGRLRDYHLADDVVQESLIVLMKKWTDFEPGTSIYAFARRIVYFKTLEAIRARQRGDVPLEEAELQAAVDRTLDECMDEESVEMHGAMIHALQDCLGHLTGKGIELVTGFYRDAKSYRELGELHAQSVEAIKKALFRYRKFLRECAARKVPGLEAVS